MKIFLKILNITLLIITGLNALIAGFLLFIKPDGSAMGMSVEYLKYSPFKSYFVPGIVLFIFIGVSSIYTAILWFLNRNNAPGFSIVQAMLLGGWILIQVQMLKDINFLHITVFSIAVILFVSGILYRKHNKGNLPLN